MVATHFGPDREDVDDFMREMGYVEKTCAYCGCLLMQSGGKPGGALLCLNGCYLTAGAKARMDAGLREAAYKAALDGGEVQGE